MTAPSAASLVSVVDTCALASCGCAQGACRCSLFMCLWARLSSDGGLPHTLDQQLLPGHLLTCASSRIPFPLTHRCLLARQLRPR